MLIALAYCTRDYQITKLLFDWIHELGGCQNHELLLLHDARVHESDVTEINQKAGRCFKKVGNIIAHAAIDGWPEGANYMWRTMTAVLSYRTDHRYFMWMEPDAIPLVSGWVEKLETEFLAGRKPFMGDRVEVDNVPLHMSGIGFYPNPLHQYAGAAYLASDIAWDMAGSNQIVPQAHFTHLIEHAWKHPSFTDVSELKTQIRPEAVLFHASKDGSLIKILRENKQPSFMESDGSEQTDMPRDARRLKNVPREPHAGRGDPSLSCDIFIRTYPADYAWLNACLRSISKYALGFRKVWIVSPQENPFAGLLDGSYEWKQVNEETEDGYLAQQIHKLYADVLTDYQADYILHIDSDTLFTRPVTPSDFLFQCDQVRWLYTPYNAIQTPWQPITEKFMGEPVENEFMRRFPIMVPRWLYPRLREFCHRKHGLIISDYIRNQPFRAFSEFNALGAYAWKNHHDRFVWVNTLGEAEMPMELREKPFARQFQSWNGITPEVKAEIENILSGGVEGHAPDADRVEKDKRSYGTPEEERSKKSVQPVNPDEVRRGTVLSGIPPSGNQVPSTQPFCIHQDIVNDLPGTESIPESLPELLPTSVPAHVKVLPGDIWVIANDTHVSKWVEQEGRLDHDQNTLPFILPHINEGDTVIDAGAFIGDHTIAYAHAVGSMGQVHAFEPNPLAMKCLEHNVQGLPWVRIYERGLGDKDEQRVSLSGNNGNAAGAYLGDHMPVGRVSINRLDDYNLKPNLIKFDIEGCELKALRGAEETIRRHRPKLILEMNWVALQRQGFDYSGIYQWLREHYYNWMIMQENCRIDSPMYDILCSPVPVPTVTLSPEVEETVRVKSSENIAAPLEASLSIHDHVRALLAHTQKGKDEKRYVRKLLYREGVVPRSEASRRAVKK